MVAVNKDRKVRKYKNIPVYMEVYVSESTETILCFYCGKEFHVRDVTLDHIIPISSGGRNGHRNLALTCGECNHAKGDKLPHEFMQSKYFLDCVNKQQQDKVNKAIKKKKFYNSIDVNKYLFKTSNIRGRKKMRKVEELESRHPIDPPAWSGKDDILFLVSIIIERVHRYVYDEIFWSRKGSIRRHKLTFKEIVIYQLANFMKFKLLPNWRTKYIQGLEARTGKYKGRYTRLDDFYPKLKRRY